MSRFPHVAEQPNHQYGARPHMPCAPANSKLKLLCYSVARVLVRSWHSIYDSLSRAA